MSVQRKYEQRMQYELIVSVLLDNVSKQHDEIRKENKIIGLIWSLIPISTSTPPQPPPKHTRTFCLVPTFCLTMLALK